MVEIGLCADGGSVIDDVVRARVAAVVASAARPPQFGNGRYVRTLFEATLMRQARRLVREDATDAAALARLTADDVTTPEATR